MRSWLAMVGMLAALVLPGTAAAQEAPPPEGGPVLTVTPNTDLIDLQAVTVSGTGFEPNDFVEVLQCPPTGGYSNCEWSFDYASTDATGAFSHMFGVAAVITDGYGNDVDCRTAPGACVIRVFGSDERSLARVGLNFDPDAPRADPPTLAADPTTDLVDGQQIHVTGSDLRPGGHMFVFVCEGTTRSDAACPNSYSAGEDDRVDENGDLDTQFRVRAVFRVGSSPLIQRPTEAQRTVDCRVSSCFLSAFEDPFNGSEVPIIPLEFDKDAPLAPTPQLQVDPSTDLVDGQAITVTGTDWFPDDDVVLWQCTTSDSGRIDTCNGPSTMFPDVDADGTFVVETTAQRRFDDWNGGVTECEPTSCVLLAFRSGPVDEEDVVVPIAFRADPSVPGAPVATPTAVQPAFTG